METQIGVRITQELKEKLEKLAVADKRTLSQWIRVQLEHLAKKVGK
jgi:predicted DNA-binding protein